MIPRHRISLRTAAFALQWLPSQGPEADAAREDLQQVLAPRPKSSVKTRRAERRKKRATKQEETGEIRTAVFVRANGRCECGVCGLPLSSMWQLDHALGRKPVRQSVRNCWALNPLCHAMKTANNPSARAWLARFVEHARRHSYWHEASLASALVVKHEAKAQLAEMNKEKP